VYFGRPWITWSHLEYTHPPIWLPVFIQRDSFDFIFITETMLYAACFVHWWCYITSVLSWTILHDLHIFYTEHLIKKLTYVRHCSVVCMNFHSTRLAHNHFSCILFTETLNIWCVVDKEAQKQNYNTCSGRGHSLPWAVAMRRFPNDFGENLL